MECLFGHLIIERNRKTVFQEICGVCERDRDKLYENIGSDVTALGRLILNSITAMICSI